MKGEEEEEGCNDGGGMEGRIPRVARRFPKIPQVLSSAKSNDRVEGTERRGRREARGNALPRAPRANYVKI